MSIQDAMRWTESDYRTSRYDATYSDCWVCDEEKNDEDLARFDGHWMCTACIKKIKAVMISNAAEAYASQRGGATV